MKSWTKSALLFLFLVSMLAAVSGCGRSDVNLVEGKINVVTTFYPLYNFASEIGGDRVHAINLVPAGVEPHDWSPNTKDMLLMKKSDLFVYQGAGFEGWVPDFLESMDKKDKVLVVEAAKGVNLIEAGPDQKEGAESRYDPHAWLSPANAKMMAENIKNALVQRDPDSKDIYEANFVKLAGRLDELDRHYREALSPLPNKQIVVSHQAFAYLCRDYGLEQKAIMGLSPDSEPTAQDMLAIIDFIKTNHVKYIFFEELVSDKLAKTLAKDTGASTLVLNPLEGLTDEQLRAGEDYVSIMEKNLKNLVKALQ